MSPLQELISIGFKEIGTWCLADSDLRLELKAMESSAPALYAFIARDEVKYVGKTIRPLGKRLYGYLKPGATQRTNIRIKAKLLASLGLDREAKVRIFGFYNAERQKIGRFILNLAAGLEDDIIHQLKPAWNGNRKEDGPERITDAISLQEPVDPGATIRPSFKVQIGATYFSSGFFNVPTDFSRYFAEDGQPLYIEAAGLPDPIAGKINRKANTTHAPRIMGGTQFKRWIQQEMQQGQAIHVTVLGPQHIKVRRA